MDLQSLKQTVGGLASHLGSVWDTKTKLVCAPKQESRANDRITELRELILCCKWRMLIWPVKHWNALNVWRVFRTQVWWTCWMTGWISRSQPSCPQMVSWRLCHRSRKTFSSTKTISLIWWSTWSTTSCRPRRWGGVEHRVNLNFIPSSKESLGEMDVEMSKISVNFSNMRFNQTARWISQENQ